jgi:hypothetical protein
MRPDRHQGPFVLLGDLVFVLAHYRGVRLSERLEPGQEGWRHYWRVTLTERGPDERTGRPGPVTWEERIDRPFDDEAAQAAADVVIERYGDVLGPDTIAGARAHAARTLEPPRRQR